MKLFKILKWCLYFFFFLTDVIASLEKFDEHVQVMIYVCNLKPNFYYLDESDEALNTIYSITNNEIEVYSNQGYNLNKTLYAIAQTQFDIPIEDLGITILMIWFGKYYSEGNYPIFINIFKQIKELNIFMIAIKQFKFPAKYTDLSIKKHHQIEDNLALFSNNGFLPKYKFEEFIKKFNSLNVDISEFKIFISPYSKNIIESFYTFTSLGSTLSKNRDCSLIVRDGFFYNLPKLRKVNRFIGDYFFTLPDRTIWFAVFDQNICYNSFMSPQIDNRIKNLFCSVNNTSIRMFRNHLTGPLVGFINNNQIYPLFVDDVRFTGDWVQIKNIFKESGFPIFIYPKSEYKNQTQNIAFVVNESFNIFKLEKN